MQSERITKEFKIVDTSGRKEIWRWALGIETKWISNLLVIHINDTTIKMVIHIVSESNHQKPNLFISSSYRAKNQTKPDYLRTSASLNYLGQHMCPLKWASRSWPSPKLPRALFEPEPLDFGNGGQIALAYLISYDQLSQWKGSFRKLIEFEGKI